MGRPKSTINVTGEISRPVLNNDGVAGFLFYNDNIADLSTMTTALPTKSFATLAEVEAEGITADSTNFKYEHYQLSEYFRMGGGKLYITITALTLATYDFAELDLLRDYSAGEVNLYATPAQNNTFVVTDVTLINAKMATYSTAKKDAHAFYAADYSNVALSALTDTRAVDNPYVSVVLGQDIYQSPGILAVTSEANVGAVVGAVSGASVEVNPSDKGVYNYSAGLTPNDKMAGVGFIDSTGIVSVLDVSDTLLDTLHDYGYIFWEFLPNQPGARLSNDSNSALATSTFNSIHIMRQRNKANRELDKNLSLLIGSKLYFDKDGLLTTPTISRFKDSADVALGGMKTRGEISDYSIYIDPSQNSISTKTVTVNASVIPVESADNIVINVAWVASI